MKHRKQVISDIQFGNHQDPWFSCYSVYACLASGNWIQLRRPGPDRHHRRYTQNQVPPARPYFVPLSAATLFPGSERQYCCGAAKGRRSHRGYPDWPTPSRWASTRWLAALTGEATVIAYTNRNLREIDKSTLAIRDEAPFNGFLSTWTASWCCSPMCRRTVQAHAIGPN